MKNKMKRIGAMIGVILLSGSVIFTLVLALLGYGFDDSLFKGMMVADICLPILLWVYIWLFGKLTKRHTMASFDLMKDKED